MHIAAMSTLKPKDISRGHRVRRIRKEVLGMSSQGEFAEALAAVGRNVSRGAVGNWELGGDIGIDNMTAIAQLSGISLEWIAYNKGPGPHAKLAINNKLTENLSFIQKGVDSVRVIGKVAANSWLDVDDMDFHYDDIQDVPTVSAYPAAWQFALLVDGNCLNKVANDGDILVCLDTIRSSVDFADGDLVVVERRRFAGQMVERTAKRAKLTANGYELWPESHDPKHQEPLRLYEGRADEEIVVVGKVLWVLKKP